MKLALLLALGAVLALAGGAAAEEVLDLIYENATSVEGCLAASVQGQAGLSVQTDPPGVVVVTPTVNPPTPACFVLPSP